MGKDDASLEWVGQLHGLKVDPSSARTFDNIGPLYLREQDFPKAAKQFRRFIKLAPDFRAAHEGLGTASAATDQLSEAVEAWKQLVELNPTAYDALYNIGVVLGRHQEELTHLERFLREAPTERYMLAAGIRERRR